MNIDEELSNPELVTFAVYNLGGSISPVDLEDVAINVYNLAPKRFSWKKYEDKIDLRIVLYSVNDAIKPNVGFLKGNSKHGYMLTKIGMSWISKIENREIFTKSSRKLSSFDLLDKEKERLLRTTAYRKFLVGESDHISIIDFREFTRVNDNFPEHLRNQRFTKIQNITDSDETLSKIWGFLKNKFIGGE